MGKAVAKHREVTRIPKVTAAYAEDLKRWNAEVRPTFDAAMKVNAKWAARNRPEAGARLTRAGESRSDGRAQSFVATRHAERHLQCENRAARAATRCAGSSGIRARRTGRRAGIPHAVAAAHRRLARALGRGFPFLFVQLPGWDTTRTRAELHDWPWLREAQLLTVKTVPRTGHGRGDRRGRSRQRASRGDKLDVGLRLALAARKVAYGEKIVASGPLYRECAIEGASDAREIHRDRRRPRHRPGAVARGGRSTAAARTNSRLHDRRRRPALGGSRREDRRRQRGRLQPRSAEAGRGPLRLGQLPRAAISTTAKDSPRRRFAATTGRCRR